jgi:transposase
MPSHQTVQTLPLPDEWPEDLAAYVCKVLDENEQLLKENEALRRKLSRYENPNVPPSQRPKKNKKPKNGDSKRGAPVGHRGATRPTPEPDEEITVTAPECPKCHKDPGDPQGFEVKSITETPKPVQPKTTRFVVAQYECKGCNHSFTARHRDCPKEGVWGIRVYLLMVALRYGSRAPLRRVSNLLASLFGIEMTAKAVQDALRRVGRACGNEYWRILQRIRKAPWMHVDETSFRVDGRNWWTWIFRSPAGDVLVVIRPSRGKNVVDEILGPEWNKPLIVDGWKAYDGRPQQRCWAHLLRYVDQNREEDFDSERLAVEVHELYKRVRDVQEEDPPPEERKRRKRELERDLAGTLSEFENVPTVKKAWTYLLNGAEGWFTCLDYPGMQPTNNDAERALRESVVFRKIIGGFRSDSGPQEYEAIASVLASWRLQGSDPFVVLEPLLRSEMC